MFKSPGKNLHRKVHPVKGRPEHSKVSSLFYQHKTEELIRKANAPLVPHHQLSTFTTSHHPKVLKKGGKKKLEEIDKKNILRGMGIEKNKMFQKCIL